MSNVPKLRFKEFEGEWVEKRLGDISEIIGGGTPDSSRKEYWNGTIPWISSSDIKENNIHKIEITRFITENAISESATKIIPKNSILIVSRVGIGKFAIAKEDLCTSQDFINLITNEDECFLAYYFSGRSNRFVRLSQGTSIKGFTGKDVKNSKFLIPSLLEQQKIATFLSSIDKKIEQLSEKERLLKAYKKGVMQKIFNQEIRFKDDDGCEFGEWVEKRLGDYGKLVKGLTYSPDNIQDEGLLVLRSSNIQNNQLSLNDNVYVDLEVKDEVITKENDILICVRNGSKRLIGKNIIIPKNLEKSTHGAFMTVFRGSSNKFVYHWLKTEAYYKEVHKNLGATINSINGSDLKKFKTFFPQSEKEQQKIANFLSSIDKKIEQTQKELEGMNLFKKGLLQEMFV